VRKSREWRERLEAQFDGLVQMLNGAGGISLTSGKDLADLLQAIKQIVLKSPDIALNLLCAYSPKIAADVERIEADAYDDEVIEALGEVLKLAYPFGALKTLFGRVAPMT